MTLYNVLCDVQEAAAQIIYRGILFMAAQEVDTLFLMVGVGAVTHKHV